MLKPPFRPVEARDRRAPDPHRERGMSTEDVVISELCGLCPVQAEGTFDGVPFYFRARGEHWSCHVGGSYDLGADDCLYGPGAAWLYEEEYGDGERYSAGWMTETEARAFIAKAYELWRERARKIVTGVLDGVVETSSTSPRPPSPTRSLCRCGYGDQSPQVVCGHCGHPISSDLVAAEPVTPSAETEK